MMVVWGVAHSGEAERPPYCNLMHQVYPSVTRPVIARTRAVIERDTR